MSGRPTKYNPDTHPKLARALAQLGKTDTEIASDMEIAESTLYLWKHKFKEFSESLKAGKDAIDDRVESTLLRKALGYEQDSIKIFQHQGEPVIIPYVEKFQPDTTSMIFWLKNRRPKEWREKHDIGFTDEDGNDREFKVIFVKPNGTENTE